jgi:SpoVK/Ycf46/Vps4 family AAA+-type ATPase
MLLTATNRPSELDEAILRRLPQVFEIGIRDQIERAEILKVVLKGEKIESKTDFDCIASLWEGYNGSDLLEPCKKAAYFPIRDLLDEENKGKNLVYVYIYHRVVACFRQLFYSILNKIVLICDLL